MDSSAAEQGRHCSRWTVASPECSRGNRGSSREGATGICRVHSTAAEKEDAAEGGAATPTYPEIFYRGATSLLAHDAPIIRPLCSDNLDFEGEDSAAFLQRNVQEVLAAQGSGE